jgi:hypothetical protein
MLGTHKKARSRNFVNSLEFPRTVVALGILIIGFMLLLAGFFDAEGNLTQSKLSVVLYLTSLISLALYLIYSGHHKKGPNE